MSQPWEQWHEVAALVARAEPVEIECALRDLPRIAPLLTRGIGSAQATFRFYRLGQGRAEFDAARCEVRATLTLTCQRCLAELELLLETQTEMAFVADEADVGAVPESHDPVLMTAGTVSLAALVEEELLLAMPIVPVHRDEARCGPSAEAETVDAPASPPTQTPFAALREMMKK
jgi:uncharacterized protein